MFGWNINGQKNEGKRVAMSEQLAGGFSAKPRTSVRVVLKPNVDLQTLNRALGSIIGRSGCRTCGLGGIDLVLTAGDPELENLAGTDGISAVQVSSA